MSKERFKLGGLKIGAYREIIDIETGNEYECVFSCKVMNEQQDQIKGYEKILMKISRRISEQQATIQFLQNENERLKNANVKWLDKSLQDKKIRYSNANHKELTKKYHQLEEENKQLKEKNEKLQWELDKTREDLDYFANLKIIAIGGEPK